MGIRFIYGRSGTGKSYTCVDEIYKESLKSEKPLILIVPEQLSFRAEKALVDKIGATGINNVHLLSFKRLAFTVFNEVGGITHNYMDETGKAIVVGRAINDVEKELTIFRKSARQKGFVDKIMGVITEFKRHNISPDTIRELKAEIDADSLLVDKLSDLEKIYDRFQKKLGTGYFDSEDDLTILNGKIEQSEFLKGAKVWIDEFNGYTPQQFEIIGKLLKMCEDVTITLPYGGNEVKGESDDTNPFYPIYLTEEKLTRLAQDYGHYPKNNVHLKTGYRFISSRELSFLEENYFNRGCDTFKDNTEDVKIFKAQNPYGEIEYAAREIVTLVKEKGMRYKDIFVIARDMADYEDIISAIFDEYNIPYFIDDKQDVSTNPLIVYITSLLNIFTKGWRDNSIINYFKTGFTELTLDEVDILENYVLQFGIKSRRKWVDEEKTFWTDISGYEGVTTIKEKALKPILKLEAQLKGTHSVKEICTAIYSFLVENGIYEKVNDYVEKFKAEDKLMLADEYSSIWNLIMELLDQFVDISGDEMMKIDDFVNMLTMSLSYHKMGLIPSSMDQVVVGSPDRMKAQEAKAVIVVGVNDGVLPRNNGDEGILNDSDRLEFKSHGISVADNSFELTFKEQYLIYNILTLANDKLYITYPIADLEGKPKRYSIIITRLKSMFKNITEETDILEDEEHKELIGKLPTFNRLIEKLHKYIDGEELSDMWKAVFLYYSSDEEYNDKLKKVIKGFTYNNHVDDIGREKIKRLYGKTCSVSKIESYANCSFGYFVKYGLKAKERKIYTFAPLDFGNIIHEGLDKFSKKVQEKELKWGELPDDFCEKLVNETVDIMAAEEDNKILKSSKRYEYIATRVRRILYRMVLIINEQMARGSFQPVGYEISFGYGKDDLYPPIPIELPSGETVELIGKIDRLDKAEIDGVDYYRVVDYKTGKINFDINDVYNGLKIQLMTYLDAVLTIENEKKNKALPGAMVYLSVDDPIMDTKKVNMDNLKEEVLKSLKMRGIVIKDLKVVKEMDRTIEGGGTSAIVPVALNKPKKGETEEAFSGKGNSVLTYSGFNNLNEHMKEKVKEVCKDMLDGIIQITPCKNGDSVCCTYCDFPSVCQFDKSLGFNNYRVPNKVKPADLFNKLEKEGGAEDGGR